MDVNSLRVTFALCPYFSFLVSQVSICCSLYLSLYSLLNIQVLVDEVVQFLIPVKQLQHWRHLVMLIIY